jgi:hypothetical protein
VFLAAAGGGLVARLAVRRAVGHQDERGARDQLAQDAAQGLVAGVFGDLQVEVARKADGAAHVAGLACGFLVADAVFERLEVRRGGLADEALDQQRLRSWRTSNTSRASASLGSAIAAPRLGVSVTTFSLASRTSTGRMRVRETPKASASRSSTSLVPGGSWWSRMAETMRS